MIDLEMRVAKLELSARRWKAAAIVMACMMIAGICIAADQPNVPDVIRAHRFEAVDDAGHVQGVLAASDHGGSVVVFDNLAECHAGMVAPNGTSGPECFLTNSVGTDTVIVSGGNDRLPGGEITLCDGSLVITPTTKPRDRTNLRIKAADNNASIVGLDGNGHQTWAIPPGN